MESPSIITSPHHRFFVDHGFVQIYFFILIFKHRHTPLDVPNIIEFKWSMTSLRFLRAFKPLRSNRIKVCSKKQSKITSIFRFIHTTKNILIDWQQRNVDGRLVNGIFVILSCETNCKRYKGKQNQTIQTKPDTVRWWEYLLHATQRYF